VPTFGPLAQAKFPDNFSWLPDASVRVGRRRIISDFDDRYFVIHEPGNEANARLKGEIIGRFVKESARTRSGKKTIYAPFTLDSLSRGVDHIRDSELYRRELLQRDIEQLAQTQSLLRQQWFQLQASQMHYISQRLLLLAHQLATAITARRSEASARVSQYHQLRDSLGRLNPLIVGGQLRKAVAVLAEQLKLDEISLEANERRALFAFELKANVFEDVHTLISLAQSGFKPSVWPRVQELLEGLRLKPFIGAAEYLLAEQADELRVQTVLQMELRLMTVSDALAALQRSPEALEQADPAVELLFNDTPTIYRPLVGRLVSAFTDIVKARMDRNYERISVLAKATKELIRYRNGLLPSSEFSLSRR
jgi:hypothetical protein